MNDAGGAGGHVGGLCSIAAAKGKSAVMNVCKSELGVEGGSLSKELGGGARSCLLCFCPTLPSPRVFFSFSWPDIDYLFSVLSVPRLFLFDVLGFLLSCTAFEGYQTGRRD